MKTRVLLLNPPFFPKFSKDSRSPAVSKGGCVYYPIWLGYTACVLEKAGTDYLLIDAPAKPTSPEEVLTAAKEFRPNMIVIETVTASFFNDAKVAEKMREEFPDSFILMVGTHTSAMPKESLMACKAIDAVSTNEFDIITREIAGALENGGKESGEWKTVKGIGFMEKGEFRLNAPMPEMTPEELDGLPFVSEIYKRFLKIEDYFYPSVLFPEVTIVSGRGCKYRCTFCKWPQTLTGHNYRARSPKNFVDELEWITKNLPQVKDVMIEDDTLTQDTQRTKEVCMEIVNRGLKVTWTCNSRADVDFETLDWMKKAGCRLMCVGFESAEQQILNNIKKGTVVPKIRQFVKDSKKAGILVHGCFMMGNHGETKETIKKTVQFAKELDPDTAQFFPLMVYPGTEAYEWAKNNGYLTTTNWNEWLLPDGSHNTIVSTPALSAKELVKACDEARREFYLRPTYIARKIIQGITHPKEFPRLFKSGQTFFKYLLNRDTTLPEGMFEKAHNI
ncbi:MAG: radical SAM protein [Candidatus Diapherotrites archaeon]|nr:radical SAM protein [Candidatus Diapherotrites archaeon]